MDIKLTPEEVKALYAYIYGGSDNPEEYRLGVEIHDKVFRTVEKEIEARTPSVLKRMLRRMKNETSNVPVKKKGEL